MILVRSLECRDINDLKDDKGESLLIIMERLVDGGYFQNNRQMIVKFTWTFIARLFRVICSMTHLEKLNLLECRLTVTENLAPVFRSCPKLAELHLSLFESHILKINEDLKNELRPAFQRLRLFELDSSIFSFPLIKEILT
jgi:hypothetical protein